MAFPFISGLQQQVTPEQLNISLPLHPAFLDKAYQLGPLHSAANAGARVETLHFLDMKSPAAKNSSLLTVSSVLQSANMKQILIGGFDNLCWIRSAWFSALRQHSLLGTANDLKQVIRFYIENSKNKDVIKFRNRIPNPLDIAFAEMDRPEYKFNCSLNSQGHFIKPIESLMYFTAAAIFAAHPKESEKSGPLFFKDKAMDHLKNFTGGAGSHQKIFLKYLQANAGCADNGVVQDPKEIPVLWSGQDNHHKKQLDTILFFANVDGIPHTNVFIDENSQTFVPASHDYIHRIKDKY